MAFRSISTTTYASRASSNVITAPTGIVNGDILVIMAHCAVSGTAATASPPAGFAVVPGPTFPISATLSGFNFKTWVWYKVAASEAGNYTYTYTGTNSTQGIMAAYSGRNTTTPWNVNVSSNTTTGQTYSATAISPVTANCDILFMAHDWGDTTNNLSPPTGTTPTFTERADLTLSYWADGTFASTGTTGAKTMTNNNTTLSPWVAFLGALAPATVTDKGPKHRDSVQVAINRSSFY